MTKIISVIISHQARIQCILKKLSNFSSREKIRFMNGSIIQIKIEKGESEITLVHSGELDKNDQNQPSIKRRYYIANNENNESLYNVQFPDLVSKQLNYKHDNRTYIFYLVRHGQASHNVDAGFHRVMDTTLSVEGQTQAENSGKALKNILETIRPNYWFISDLQRANQTLLAFWGTFFFPNIEPPKTIVAVLPCSHELSTDDENCDATSANNWRISSYKKMALENYPSCSVNNLGPYNSFCRSVHFIQIDWGFYKIFYSDITRSEKDYLKDYFYSRQQNRKVRNYCRDTNMISLAILYIQNNGNVTKQILNEFIKEFTENPFQLIPEQTSGDSQKDDEPNVAPPRNSWWRKLFTTKAANNIAPTQKRWWHFWRGGKTLRSIRQNNTTRNRSNNPKRTKLNKTRNQKKNGQQNNRRIRTTRYNK